MWNLSEESDTPLSQSQHRHQHHYRRQSLCELEGDATISGNFPDSKFNCLCFMYDRTFELASSLVDILNQQFKMYNSLSQAQSDTNMVQSLVAIWEVHSTFLVLL